MRSISSGRYGSRRMRDECRRAHGQPQAGPAPRQMDLRALYPRRRTSQPGKGHKIYPYLLRDLSIERANQAWASDISYIPMAKGFMYLVAIMDWYSRRVRHGGCRTPWIRTSVSKRWRKLYSALKRRRSSIPTKGPSSPVKRSPTCSTTTPLRSAWMARADGWTTCSSSVCGARQVRGRVPAGLRNAHRASGRSGPLLLYNTRRRHSALDRRDAVYFDQAQAA